MSTRQVHSETRQHNSIVSEMLYAFCDRPSEQILLAVLSFHSFLDRSSYPRMDSSAAWQLLYATSYSQGVLPFECLLRSAQVVRFTVHAGKRAIDEAKFELSHLWRWLWRNFGDEGLLAELSCCWQIAHVQAIR